MGSKQQLTHVSSSIVLEFSTVDALTVPDRSDAISTNPWVEEATALRLLVSASVFFSEQCTLVIVSSSSLCCMSRFRTLATDSSG